MTVYIDPPRWPAHGTVFSHIVSDASIAELHDFARALGVSERAFDRDHYDVPAHRHAAAVALGAVPVDGKQLARLLIRSGLRIPARRRPAKLAAALTARWRRHFPRHPDMAGELLQRWSEPHRAYHGPAHLLDVLEAVDLLTAADEHPELVLAAWFHDAVHEGTAGQDERDSAALARRLLSTEGWPEGVGDRVADLVLVTEHHSPDPGDREACLLVDADLSVLGAGTEDYDRYRAAVRREYADVPEEQFTAARAEVLRALREKPQLFHEPRAVALWEERARRNLDRELGILTRA
ncbi:DUF4031 domain-containing protein [Kocuria tytonis]|uniref:DUF4031 domain-containing protein n=1 Tax=Kocuria tytonis TaxID=2054280 RepID=A0A495A4F1_9MICC|nr:DUF4031 domain-containing protein [Kocuria tytonis]RKQ34069.1 DUF4031 domain-containing protein [Kocuria tytonis]